METEGVCANCVAGKQQHDCFSVSPDVEALSWLSVPCPSLASLCVSGAASMSCSAVYSLHWTFPQSCTDTQYKKINNYHSVMVIVLVCFTHHKCQFYINHLSDILWDGWLYLPVVLCTVSVVCAERRQGAGVPEHIFC